MKRNRKTRKNSLAEKSFLDKILRILKAYNGPLNDLQKPCTWKELIDAHEGSRAGKFSSGQRRSRLWRAYKYQLDKTIVNNIIEIFRAKNTHTEEDLEAYRKFTTSLTSRIISYAYGKNSARTNKMSPLELFEAVKKDKPLEISEEALSKDSSRSSICTDLTSSTEQLTNNMTKDNSGVFYIDVEEESGYDNESPPKNPYSVDTSPSDKDCVESTGTADTVTNATSTLRQQQNIVVDRLQSENGKSLFIPIQSNGNFIILQKLLQVQTECWKETKRMADALEESNKLKKYALGLNPNTPCQFHVVDL